jgi:hypothetical protein
MEHMKYRQMDVPERMKNRPQYKGVYIPYLTEIAEDGAPLFKQVDPEKTWEVKRDGKCALCGEKLDYWKAFMVNKQEAESRIVFENPNHEDCLRYAFNVCPWLYYSRATYSAVSDEIDELGRVQVSSHPDRDETNQRQPEYGLYITNRYENIIIPLNGIHYRVCKVGKAKRLEWIAGK